MEQRKTKRIAYISTLKGVPWGGSEELWLLSSITALENQNEIGVFIYDWNKLPSKIQLIKDKGAKIFKRPIQPSILHRILKKVCDKLKFSYPNFLNPYNPLIKFNPDAIVITDGATYYTANDIWLEKILLQYFKQKFVIICQGNTHYHMPKSRDNAIKLYSNAKKVVFVSNRNREECSHQLVHNLQNTMVIQNPINLSKIELLPMPSVIDGSIHIAIVGRLFVADKGTDMIISLASLPQWKNSNVYFHIYGSGNDKDYLLNLIKYYKVEEKVFVEGFSDPLSIYKKCHCLLMPSLLEGTSLSLLEAMALGRVCIITDVGGSCEWINDGENGYLIEAPTVELIDKKLKLAFSNKEKWPTIGEKAHQQIIENIDRTPGETLFKSL